MSLTHTQNAATWHDVLQRLNREAGGAEVGHESADSRASTDDALRGIAALPEAEVEQLLAGLMSAISGRGASNGSHSPAAMAMNDAAANPSIPINGDERLLAEIFEQLRLRYREAPAGSQPATNAPPALGQERSGQIVALYRRLGAASGARHLLLRVLASAGGEQALATLVEAVLAEPLRDAKQCDAVFAPLFQLQQLPIESLFPRLFAALEQPALAVQVIDLANYVARRGWAKPHPAASRLPQLLTLYAGLVNNLQSLEKKPTQFAADAVQLRQVVSGCVELLVALSSALALIADPRAVGKLRQALELSHRRLRAEAAAALAALGDEEGTKVLVELAAEPSVRRRAIAYLDELGQVDAVPDEFRTEVALAEAELAAWLAEPTQFGLAPTTITLRDSRRQRWPGYEEPVDCYLFRYEYHFPRGLVRGVGIVGPLVRALGTDISHLPPEDIYALYAGWHAEHEEAADAATEQLSTEDAGAADAARRELEEIGYEEVRVARVGRFFGDAVVVASARLAGEPGLVVSAGDQAQWFPHREGKPPLQADEVYCLFKGRALLAAFNPAERDERAEQRDDRAPRPR